MDSRTLAKITRKPTDLKSVLLKTMTNGSVRTNAMPRFIFEYLVNSIGENSYINSLTLRFAFVKSRLRIP